MKQQHAASRIPNYTPWRLQGPWLAIARGVWIVLALLLLVNFIASIPAYFMQLHTICTGAAIVRCNGWYPTAGNLQALHHLGLSLDSYAAYTLSLNVGVSLVFLAVGIVIFWRKSDEWQGLFVSLLLMIFGSFGIADTLAGRFINAHSPFALQLLGSLLVDVQWPALGIFLLTFPTGRFVPRWTWILVLLWVMQDLFFAFGNIGNWPPVLFATDLLLAFGSVLGVQVYRYLRVYNPGQRQQTKWLVFAFTTAVVLEVLYLAIGQLIPAFNQPDSLYHLAYTTVAAFLFLLIPLSIGVAILRYHLWDIDVLINRTLVYGLLTGTLVIVYVGLIIGLQFLLRGIIDQNSTISIVASTLVIAALFQPLRRYIQHIIDRHFYRRRYDAAKILEAFSASLRTEVDLNRLSELLLAAVEETLQPAHVSLWLLKPEHPEEHKTQALPRLYEGLGETMTLDTPLINQQHLP